jgi:hypothetical protein
VFRAGAEGAKRADPKAQVTNGGWAGLSMDWIDQMRTYRYADGKNPLDFTDILNVHFYSGKQEPELCTSDPNVYRNSAKTDQVQTYEKDLIDLADWRDDVKPGMKIWLTETGNDVGGPMGRTERYQAAKIPRCFMIALANNVEKVFLYRDTGSTPAQHAGSGLIRNDGSLRPSLFSLATMIRQLDGVPDGRVPRLVSADPRLWMYRWKKGADSVVTVWTPEGTIPLGLDLGKCQITDSFGAVKEMDVTKTFEVGIFPVYLTKIGTPAPLDVLEREAIAREAQRQKDRAFRLKTKAYLFQFGSKDPIATKIIGQPRPFVPVLADTLHDTAKGYGFVGEVGGKNSFRHWYPETVDKGSILFWKATPFRVDAEPGIYELAMKVERANKDSQVVLSGDPAGDRTLVFDAKTNQATAKITVVKDQPLIFTIPGDNTNAVWLTMIKTAETK